MLGMMFGSFEELLLLVSFLLLAEEKGWIQGVLTNVFCVYCFFCFSFFLEAKALVAFFLLFGIPNYVRYTDRILFDIVAIVLNTKKVQVLWQYTQTSIKDQSLSKSFGKVQRECVVK